MKKRDALERIKRVMRGVEKLLKSLKKQYNKKDTSIGKEEMRDKWANAVRVLTMLKRKLKE